MSTIFTDQYLEMLAGDAANDFNNQSSALYHKFYLNVTAGLSVYTLPDKVNGILRITWRGKKLEPVSWDELTVLTPGTVVVDGASIETSQSRPQWYALHPTNYRDIRFYPTPDETLTDGFQGGSGAANDPYSPIANETRCTVSCWRTVDQDDSTGNGVLPSYIYRRMVKAYVCWKCFEKEGPGQDSKAAAYYKEKYNFLLDTFKFINSQPFVSKRYGLGNASIEWDTFRYPKPMLPANFERIIY